MPAYSAFSQKTSSLEDQSNQGDVIFMNYGRMEDYEDLLRQGESIQTMLKNDIIIARYKNIINIEQNLCILALKYTKYVCIASYLSDTAKYQPVKKY